MCKINLSDERSRVLQFTFCDGQVVHYLKQGWEMSDNIVQIHQSNIGNFRCTNPILLVYTNVWSLADSGIWKFDKFVGKKVYMYTTIQTKIASLKIIPGQVLYILQIVQYIFSYFPYTFFNKIFFKKEKKPQNSTMCLSFKYGFDLSVGKLLFRCCYSIIGFLQEIPRFMSYLKGVFFSGKN